jgi:hypothetical protein
MQFKAPASSGFFASWQRREGLTWVTCGRRPGKNFLTFCSVGRVRSRVRPVDAAGVAAGPNALRGSGLKQKRALLKMCVDPSGFSRSPERPYLHYVVMPSPIGVADLEHFPIAVNRGDSHWAANKILWSSQAEEAGNGVFERFTSSSDPGC